jgi:hypothetical protein
MARKKSQSDELLSALKHLDNAYKALKRAGYGHSWLSRSVGIAYQEVQGEYKKASNLEKLA